MHIQKSTFRHWNISPFRKKNKQKSRDRLNHSWRRKKLREMLSATLFARCSRPRGVICDFKQLNISPFRKKNKQKSRDRLNHSADLNPDEMSQSSRRTPHMQSLIHVHCTPPSRQNRFPFRAARQKYNLMHRRRLHLRAAEVFRCAPVETTDSMQEFTSALVDPTVIKTLTYARARSAAPTAT
jgi:hypothetical protein